MEKIENLRLNDGEQEGIEKIYMDMNNVRFKNQKNLLKKSQIAHNLLELGLKMAKIDSTGEIYLEESN